MRSYSLIPGSSRYRGVALVEFAIVVGFVILPLCTAIFSIGRFLWQIQFVSDAARFGVRSANALSHTDNTLHCNELLKLAKGQALAYRTSIIEEWEREGRSPSKLWNDPVVAVFPAYTFRGVKMRSIELRFPPKEQDNCLVCYQSLLRRILPRVSASFDISMKSACIDDNSTSYQCPEDQICSGPTIDYMTK